MVESRRGTEPVDEECGYRVLEIFSLRGEGVEDGFLV